tara:strand:- start:1423 stop:1626 length:204 start_codon:yes stop_codon:yes gene_type:complete
MRGENKSINIKHNITGEVKRVKRFKARPMVEGGPWNYISSTIYNEATRPKVTAPSPKKKVKKKPKGI